jgi:hypothetical protein
MTERALQSAVIELARMRGWLVYHTYLSARSEPGFPDLVLVHEQSGALVFAELKSDRGKVTAAQDRWLRALALRGAAFVWRPEHLRGGSIDHALRMFGQTADGRVIR